MVAHTITPQWADDETWELPAVVARPRTRRAPLTPAICDCLAGRFPAGYRSRLRRAWNAGDIEADPDAWD